MTIFDFLNSNLSVFTALLILVLVVAILYLVAFLQGRSISFWPPKIGAKPYKEFGAPKTGEPTPEVLRFNGYGIVKVGYFPEFTEIFNNAIPKAKEMTLCFIHSRRWRENHANQITQFLERRQNKLIVLLPNLANQRLMESLKEHFDDGPNMEAFIKDAYRFFADILQRKPDGVDIRLFDLYPTYSFYQFDDILILAMYPNSPLKKDVPTFQIINGGKYWDFVQDDIRWVMSKTTPVGLNALRRLMN